ncbi:MAG: zinc metalloprotease [Erythrobacter sp. 34-65-8]|nr:MAG: zinc metalloprotease [Erythrobacter sp. 34-65-8]
MRLNRFDPNNIRVGTTSGGGGFPGGGGGKLGCGTVLIAIIGALVFGLDPAQTIGALGGGEPAELQQQADTEGQSTEELCTSNQYSLETCNALSSLNQTWERIFQEQNAAFSQPTLKFVTSNQFNSGCGPASTGMGPFYCPADQGIYIDTGFYEQLAQMAGERGDFARYYVVAHEYGHHVQTITGVAEQIRSAQQQNPRAANRLQTLMELHADCYAGVWAGRNRNLIEPGDMEEGMNAAASIGDDTLQRNSGQRVDPESFTHGSSAQRMQALRLGLETGDDRRCDGIFETG